jgi:predicted membrane protein
MSYIPLFKISDMNQEDFKQRIEQRWGHGYKARHQGRIWVGLFILIIGGFLMARASGIYFPAWFFSWPMILIGFGFITGIRHGFRNIGWLFPVAVGAIFLADRISPDLYIRPYFWPAVVIAIGLLIIFKPKGRFYPRHNYVIPNGDAAMNPASDVNTTVTSTASSTAILGSNYQSDPSDKVDITAIFGGVKRNVISKNFQGGDVTAFMGGAEINLTQADFTGKASVDCFNMFGGTKLIIPPDWDIQSEVVAIFGGIDDKRPPMPHGEPRKVLVLDGTCLFGGIEIKSF